MESRYWPYATFRPATCPPEPGTGSGPAVASSSCVSTLRTASRTRSSMPPTPSGRAGAQACALGVRFPAASSHSMHAATAPRSSVARSEMDSASSGREGSHALQSVAAVALALASAALQL